jgi:hypothetical protein
MPSVKMHECYLNVFAWISIALSVLFLKCHIIKFRELMANCVTRDSLIRQVKLLKKPSINLINSKSEINFLCISYLLW